MSSIKKIQNNCHFITISFSKILNLFKCADTLNLFIEFLYFKVYC